MTLKCVNGILSGSDIRVEKGGLRVEGWIGDNVKIVQENSVNYASISHNHGSITINGNSSVTSINSNGNTTIIVDGVDVTEEVAKKRGKDGAKSKMLGIEISGNAGSNVSVSSTESIRAKNFGEKSGS